MVRLGRRRVAGGTAERIRLKTSPPSLVCVATSPSRFWRRVSGAPWRGGYSPVSSPCCRSVRSSGFAGMVPTCQRRGRCFRYLPVVGAARMPTRMTVLVMLGLAMLCRSPCAPAGPQPPPVWWTSIAVACLGLELLPAPRRLFSAAVPDERGCIAADPRESRAQPPVRLKDGLTSGAGFRRLPVSPTVHEKPLIGDTCRDYPRRDRAYRRDPFCGW